MERLYKNGLVTTILGLGILGFCCIMMYQTKATPGDMSGWLAVGLMFLRSKDSLIGLGV